MATTSDEMVEALDIFRERIHALGWENEGSVDQARAIIALFASETTYTLFDSAYRLVALHSDIDNKGA